MHHGVPLVEHLHRVRPEVLFADLDPAVARIGHVAAEQRDRRLVVPHRGVRQPGADQLRGPVLHLAGGPPPGVVAGEPGEPAHQQLALLDRVPGQHPRPLLGRPARQHRLQHRLLRRQQRHPGRQQLLRRPHRRALRRPTAAAVTDLIHAHNT